MSEQLPSKLGQPELTQDKHNQGNADAQEGEISLLDLLLTVLRRKSMILAVTLLAGVLAAGVSLLMQNSYRGEIIIAAAATGDKKEGSLGMALGSLGGLASLTGVSLGGGGSNEENLAILKSRDFLWEFVQAKNLMPILFEDLWDKKANRWKEEDPKKQPGQMDVFRLLKDIMTVEVEKKTNLITVTIEWKDAKLAAEWTNSIVEYLNQYLAERAIKRSERNLQYLNEALMKAQIEEFRKTLFDLIAQDTKNAMLASAQKDFAFKVIDAAVVPDKKAKPKRAQIVILAMLAAFFFAVIWAFASEALQRASENPEQAKRLAELRRALRFKR